MASDPSVFLPLPTQTLVVGQDGEVILALEGILLLPLGSRVELKADEEDAAVVGIRLAGADMGTPRLILEVDSGGSSFATAAIKEADAEAQVIEAAERITAEPASATSEVVPGLPSHETGAETV